jgi:hypothetical protein
VPPFIYRPFNKPIAKRLATTELHSKIRSNFKEVLHHHQEIKSCIELLKLFLEVDYQCCIEEADCMDSLDA